MSRRLIPGALLAASLLLVGGCGGGGGAGASSATAEKDTGGSKDADASSKVGAGAAADTTVCRADAKAVPTPYAATFPTEWAFPPGSTAYDVEDRGESGIIVTAVSSTPFADVLAFLNHDQVDNGFKILSGETEDHDAEATWDAGKYRGRWAIRESATCSGETVIQVVAVPAS